MPTVVLNNLDEALAWARNAPTAYPITVSWVQGVDRSKEQNALMWRWASDVAKQRGDVGPDEVQAEWKLHHGVPILRAEDDDFRAFYDSAMMGIGYEKKLEIMRRGFPVTRDMKTRQMSEFMDRVQAECAQMGWYLTSPVSGSLTILQPPTRKEKP